ncbi:MAG: cytochrome c oxidase accessory protein CcoG [Rubrivivax sp. SCN 70-15]|nr:MAG: cytochrome c oxidase accessory protein CcoG [Rubrivivax sp. SCN 70-15]
MSQAARTAVIPIRPVATGPDDELTVSMYEKQAKIYPRSVSGWFARWRWSMVWLTQLVFYGAPWLQWNGRQAMLFDLTERRFFVFGLVLQPQDLIYLAALLVIAALSLFLFTAVAGRLWCGYACPQTVYTEMFLWVERRLEGDRVTRMRLDAAPWGMEKLSRKGGKHAVWLAIGLFTGFTFVGYFTPIRMLAAEATTLALSAWQWFWILFYGLATYGNAGYMREQVCKYMCPYARFQSALIDKDSLVIAYDAGRGEARGSRPRKADARALGLGDCIDCTLCVQVCPTGIDIRNGLQNECIGCAACIDVCDDVMGKMGYPTGLIRYSTENGVARGWSRAQMLRRSLRPRVLVYAGVLLTVITLFVTSLYLRSEFAVDVIKDRSTLARTVDHGAVENVYRLQIANGTEQPHRYRVEVTGLRGLKIATPAEIDVEGTRIGSLAVRVALDAVAAEAHRGQVVPIAFEVTTSPGGQRRTVDEKSTFFVPR